MISLDEKTYRVIVHGKVDPIDVTRTEWAILKHLYDHKDKVVGKRELVQLINEPKRDLTENAIEVHITHLRQRLGADVILTRRGFGYQLNTGETQ